MHVDLIEKQSVKLSEVSSRMTVCLYHNEMKTQS